MEIYFDRKNISILRYIRWHKNVTLDDIQAKFGEDADSFVLVRMCKAGYLLAIKDDGAITDYNEQSDFGIITGKEKFWVSPKGKKVLDDRFDRLWQWFVPTLISVAALIISLFSLYNPQ